MQLKRLSGAVFGIGLALAAGPALAQTQQLKMGAGLAGTYPLYSAKFADMVNKNVPGVQVSPVSVGSVEAQADMQKGELQLMLNKEKKRRVQLEAELKRAQVGGSW